MMKRLFFIVVMMVAVVTAIAQTLTGSAPSHVAVGEQFRLTYTVNTQNVSDFRAGDIPDELEVLIGPNRFMQSSYQTINGHTSSTSSITYTYIVAAAKNGTYTIPPAHVTVGGKSIASRPLTIKVTGSAAAGQGGHSRTDVRPKSPRFAMPVHASLVPTSSSRSAPTRSVSTNRNLSCLPIRCIPLSR
jgi:hypothetical protein